MHPDSHCIGEGMHVHQVQPLTTALMSISRVFLTLPRDSSRLYLSYLPRDSSRRYLSYLPRDSSRRYLSYLTMHAAVD